MSDEPRHPVADLLTLGEIATRTAMLNVACSRCDRRGGYRLDNLIARHGADAAARVIVAVRRRSAYAADIGPAMFSNVVTRASGPLGHSVT